MQNTGEGRLDGQSIDGKLVSAVLARAAAEKPVYAIVGSLGEGFEPLYLRGLSGVLSLADETTTVTEAIERAEELYAERLFTFFRYLSLL